MSDDIKEAPATVEGHPELSLQDGVDILINAVSAILLWMPPFERSKAIIVADPRTPGKLLAVHLSHSGVAILADADYEDFISLLCTDCQVKVKEYSVIHTGQDLQTGELDPEAFMGLEGAHDEDEQAVEEFDEYDAILSSIRKGDARGPRTH